MITTFFNCFVKPEILIQCNHLKISFWFIDNIFFRDPLTSEVNIFLSPEGGNICTS